MTRIISGGGAAGSKIVGRPGGYAGLKKTGLLTRANKIKHVTPQRVRRLYARSPSNRTAIIGTSKDVLMDSNLKWNLASVRMRDSNQFTPFGKRKLKVAPGTADQGNNARERRQPNKNYTNLKIVKY